MAEDIDAFIEEVMLKAKLTQKEFAKRVGVSKMHLTRVKKDPVKWAWALKKIMQGGKEILEEVELKKQNRLSEDPLTYGGGTDEDPPESIDQRLYLMSLDIAHLTGMTRIQNQRLVAENKAFKEYFASDGTAEDKKILRDRLEQIELTYNPASTIEDTIVPVSSITAKPRKKKPKKSDSEQPSPPEEPAPGSGS